MDQYPNTFEVPTTPEQIYHQDVVAIAQAAEAVVSFRHEALATNEV